MLRVGTGVAKGRRLKSVTGTIRPTSSRVRGSLFDILSTRIGGRVVLDLCAGSGILGIEALSRGACCCLFVDNDRGAVQMIRDNLARCGFGGQHGRQRAHGRIGSNGQHGLGRVWRADAVRSLGHLADRGCVVDIIFADPPYGDPVAREVIRTIDERGVLAPDGLLVLEHRGDDAPETCAGLDLVRRLDIGTTALSFFGPVPTATARRSDVLPTDLAPPSLRNRR